MFFEKSDYFGLLFLLTIVCYAQVVVSDWVISNVL